RHRLTFKTASAQLGALGVQTHRIIDIQVPARNVMALLVHQDYQAHLEEALRQHDQPIAADYHPHEPRFLADPALTALSHEEQVSHAKDIFRKRLLRTLTHARARHIGQLARSFVSQG
ncbi:hypothetical protein BC940DRAFT_224392, partial [Gongronella butleri]